MLLSIIIPVYNVEQFIGECLDSVCTQSFADWEAICVNDGSTDCSLSLLQEFASRDSRIHVVSQSNAGLSAARNTGLRAANGEYVLFLDSDDKLSNNDALQHLVDSIEGDYDMICFSGRRFLDGTNKYLPADELIPATYTSGMEYFDKNFMAVRNFPFVCVVLRAYRRNFLLDNNIWFENGIYHEDNRFTPIVCYYASMVKVINHCVYDYRYREGSITTTKVNPKRADDLLDTANYLAKFFSRINHLPFRRSMYRYVAQVYNSAVEKGAARTNIDWFLYYRVSTNRLRHMWFFMKNFWRRNK